MKFIAVSILGSTRIAATPHRTLCMHDNRRERGLSSPFSVVYACSTFASRRTCAGPPHPWSSKMLLPTLKWQLASASIRRQKRMRILASFSCLRRRDNGTEFYSVQHVQLAASHDGSLLSFHASTNDISLPVRTLRSRTCKDNDKSGTSIPTGS